VSAQPVGDAQLADVSPSIGHRVPIDRMPGVIWAPPPALGKATAREVAWLPHRPTFPTSQLDRRPIEQGHSYPRKRLWIWLYRHLHLHPVFPYRVVVARLCNPRANSGTGYPILLVNLKQDKIGRLIPCQVRPYSRSMQRVSSRIMISDLFDILGLYYMIVVKQYRNTLQESNTA
jgi:hypothetical protein